VGTILGYSDRFSSGSAIVPAGANAHNTIKLYVQYAANAVVIDYNGYFANTPDSGQGLNLYTNTPFYAIRGVNNSTACSGICGVEGVSASTQTHSFGVGGVVTGNADDSAGTFGQDNTGVSNPTRFWASAGVRGEGVNGVIGATSTSGGVGVIGDYASSDGSVRSTAYLGYATWGIKGITNSTTSWAAGVIGGSSATAVRSFGVDGYTSDGGTNGSAGVFGYVSGQTLPNATGWYAAGVRGESATRGVLGMTYSLGYGGVVGQYYANQSNSVAATSGHLGYNSTYGVYRFGDVGASGNKSFIEPHPSDPTKVIRYIALEGNEAGTYFRGRGRFVGREAVIDVPEDFRIVTDAEGLSIQVTPIGDLASVAVVSISLDEIVLKSSRDVEFFYTVNGLRKAYKELQPIMDNDKFYVPGSAEATMPAGLSKEAQLRLISNGTYNADGTVNIDTARRVGWVKQWEARDLQIKAQAEAAAAKQAVESPIAGQGRKGQPVQQP
jgi:hypothetical protein